MVLPRLLPPSLLLLALGAPAQSVPPLSLAEAASSADWIVTATVRSSRSRWSDDRTTIRTFVALGDVVVHHGTVPGGEPVLRFDGGQVGDDRIAVAGMPVLREGGRYLLFVRGNGEHVSPIVGFHQGVFEVRETASGEVLVDAFGRELVEVREGRLVVAERRSVAGAATPRPSGPQVLSIDHTVVAAAADVERREGQQLARGTARPLPLPELPATGPAVRIPAAGRSAVSPPARVEGSTPLGAARHPILLAAGDDPGRRVNLAAMLRFVGEVRR